MSLETDLNLIEENVNKVYAAGAANVTEDLLQNLIEKENIVSLKYNKKEDTYYPKFSNSSEFVFFGNNIYFIEVKENEGVPFPAFDITNLTYNGETVNLNNDHPFMQFQNIEVISREHFVDESRVHYYNYIIRNKETKDEITFTSEIGPQDAVLDKYEDEFVNMGSDSLYLFTTKPIELQIDNFDNDDYYTATIVATYGEVRTIPTFGYAEKPIEDRFKALETRIAALEGSAE